ncbi:hypothetical protein Bca4012_058552 [Brassica carinata]
MSSHLFSDTNCDESDDDSLDPEVSVSFHLIFSPERRCIYSYKKASHISFSFNIFFFYRTSLESKEPPRRFAFDSLRRFCISRIR